MNNRNHTIKYILSDFFSASFVWIIFNVFRKRVIESEVYGKIMPLELNFTLFYNTLLIAVFWILLYYFSGYYYKIYRKSRLQEFSQTLIFSILGNIFIFFTLLLDDIVAGYQDYYYSFITLLSLHFFLTFIPRSIITTRTIHRIRKGKIGFNTLIIGSGQKALDFVNSYSTKNHWGGYKFVGFVNVNNGLNEDLAKICRFSGTLNDLEKIVDENKIEEVIIAVETDEHKELETIIGRLQLCNTSIKIIPDLFEILIGKTELALIEGTPLILIAPELMPIWEKNLKLVFDKLLAILFLTMFSPLYIFASIGIRISSGGPVIYRQKRVGLNGKEFTIYKFRSMIVDAEKNGPELSSANDTRVTIFGQFMRRVRLDEIPQFFNVLIGDMSVVGPRPERRFYIDQIIEKAPEYMMLLRTRPGITSLGQVKFGYAENIEQMLNRLKYDIIYIKNMSLYLDFKILIYTILTVIKQDGK